MKINFRKELPHSIGASVRKSPDTFIRFRFLNQLIGYLKFIKFRTPTFIQFWLWISLLKSSVIYSQPPVNWMHNYTGVSTTVSDSASFLVTGNDGRIYVTGSSQAGIQTVAYGPSGNVLWTQIIAGNNSVDRSGSPCGILMDQNGNLIIAGTINNTGTNKDFVICGYDPNGRERFREVYNSNLDDIAVDLAINPAGWIFITGYTVGANYSQINTIRCIPNGSLEIVKNYYIPGQNIYPSGIALDASSNVFITGTTEGTGISGKDIITIKYSFYLDQLWASSFNSAYDTVESRSIAVDPSSGNINIGGVWYSGPGTKDVQLIQYASSGTQLWAQRFNSAFNLDDDVCDIKTDNSGNIILAGKSQRSSSQFSQLIAKYNSSGVYQWSDNWWKGIGAGNNSGNSIAIDLSGNILTCGRIDSITGSYAAVAKYTPGGSRIAEYTYNSGSSSDIHLDAIGICADGDPVVAGMEQNNTGDRNKLIQKLNSSFLASWSSGGPFQNVTWEEASITDTNGNIYVTGFSQLSPGGNNSIVTLKYNKSGTLIWSQVYQAPSASIDLRGIEIALDGAGNIYICGTIIPTGVPWSFLTLKYNSNGVLQWNQTYNSTGNFSEFALGIVVDAGGNCYVGGTSSNGSNQNLQIVKYNSIGQQQWATIFDDPDHLNDHFLSMTLDPSGNLYISGYAIDNVLNGYHFYLKLTSAGAQSWFISGGNQQGTYYSRHMNGLKFISGYLFCAVTRSWSTNSEVILHQISEAGNSILTTVINIGTGIISANDFEVDASLNCYLTGVIQTTSLRKCFTEKFSPGFNSQWRKEYPFSNSGSSGMALKVDASGHIYVACWPETYLYGVSESVILKYKTDGTLLWSDYTVSGPKYYEPDDIHLDAYGNIDIVGSSIIYYPPSIDKAAGSIIVFQYNESLQTGVISPGSFCKGSQISVPFQTTAQFNANNVFTAQLSDASGNFSNPVAIGSIAGTSSGTINATIPMNANTGSGYRIRVLSNSPEVTSFDNGVNLSIAANPFVTITGTTGLCEGAPANPVANPSGGTYSWSTGETSQSIVVTQAGTFSVTVTNGTGCTSSASVAIQQASNPQPVISFYPSLTVCQGSFINLYCPGYSFYQWSNGSTTQVTSVATAGTYTVTVTDSKGCTGTSPSVTTSFAGLPVITSFSPIATSPGATVTLNGSGFNSDPSKNYVYFGATKGYVSSATGSQLSVVVPGGATHSRIMITTNPAECGFTIGTKEIFVPSSTCQNTALTFGSASTFAGIGSPKSLLLSDLDGDGKSEVVIANLSSSAFSVFRNTSSPGSISFAIRQDINAGGGQVEVASEDMDGDGKKDLVFTRSGSSLVTLLRNISIAGSVAFENPVNLVLSGNPEGLALGDWDGDGSVDIAISLPGTSPNNQIIIYRNTNIAGTINPSLFFAGTNLTSGTTPNRIASADIDKDGKTDLLSVNAGSNSLSVFRNISTSGTISFLNRVDFTTGTNPSGGLAVADFDRDGKIDVAITNFASNSFSVFRNTSTSGIINASSFAARLDFSSGAGSGPIRLSISDFDGDTKPDIAVMTTASNAIRLYRNTSPVAGTITFGTAVSYTHSVTSPTQVASGDVDNDSHADLLYCDGSLNNFYTRRATAAYASITPAGSTSFCSGLSLTLFASGGASYLWSTGATTPSITVNTAGAYNVIVNGCTSTPVVTEVLPLPTVAIVPSGPTQLCPGTTVTLNATPGLIAYSWSNGATTSAITTGTNSIYSVTAYNSNGCSATSANVTVSIKEINTTPGVSVSKCYGGSGADYSVSSIGDHPHLINPDGSHVFCGIINSSDGQITGYHGGQDGWVVKTNAAGAILWQRALGGSDLDGLYSIHSTSDNGYIVCGYTRSNDGDVSGNHSAGFNTDAWVVKLDANGAILWQKCLGGLSGESFNSIIETPDGGYLCGGSNYAVGGDVTVNYGNYDFWVTKLSSAGILQWQKSYGGSGEDKAKSIILLSDGNYLVGGNSGSNDIDVSGNHGSMDNWIIKINASGTILWQKCFGGTGTEDLHSIEELADGSLISSGVTNSTNGDVSGNHGNYDLWVTKFSNSGTLIWQKCIGGSNSEYGGDIVLSMDGGMVIAGSTASNNGDVSGFHGSMDGWLVKLDGNGNILWNGCYGGSVQDEAGGILQSGDGNYSFVGSTSSTNGDVSNNQGSNDVWMVLLKNPDIISNGSLTTCSGNTITLTATAGTSFLWNNGSNASSITVNETGTYQVTADECFLSDPVEVIFNPCDFNVLTRNFIEGYYLGNNAMIAAINPVSEPLKCDTAYLELHSINPPYSFLYKDTAIIDIHGYGDFHFHTSPDFNSYYLVLKQRNSLGIWSGMPVSVPGAIAQYDFTTGATQAYGGNQVNLGDGNFALYSGDINQDGTIDMADLNLWETNGPIRLSGYLVEDLNGDGLSESVDYSLLENNINLLLVLLGP